MSIPQPPVGNFQELFCAQYEVPPARFCAAVLQLTLYPHARWLAVLNPSDWLAPDRYFIECVGRLTRRSGFADEAYEFQQLPENRRFGRRHLRLRVSVHRMRVLLSEVMGRTPSSGTRGLPLPEENQAAPGLFAAE